MRRISAHYIFPDASPPLRNAIITINGDNIITDISPPHSSVQEGEGIEFYSGVIAPAFVNAHCHLELSHLKGRIEQGKGLPHFIQSIAALRNSADNGTILSAARFADAVLYQSGTAAVADISNGDASFAIKRTSSVHYHTFIEKFGLNPASHDAVILQMGTLLQAASQNGLAACPTIHAPYSILPPLLASIMAMAAPNGILSIHHQESPDEQPLFASHSGALASMFVSLGLQLPPAPFLHPLQYLAQYVNPSMRPVFVHNTYMTPEQYDFAVSNWRNAAFVLCPHSNIYIHNALPPVEMLMQKGTLVALGTDSWASHPSLRLIDDMILLQKHFPRLSLRQLLSWASINGAKILGIDNKFGSIAIGRAARLVWIQGVDLHSLRLLPFASAQRII